MKQIIIILIFFTGCYIDLPEEPENKNNTLDITKWEDGIVYYKFDSSLSESELESDFRQYCSKICDLVESISNPITVRMIMDGVSSSYENESIIYTAIKWLLEKGILERDENTRCLFKGYNWHARPIMVNIL